MYQAFDKFVLRTPFFPCDILDELSLDTITKHPQFRESIFLASPLLYEEMLKMHDKETKKKEKVAFALYRYAERMSFRCTPLGLFAGLSIGNIGNQTTIILGKNRRIAKLDMQFLYTLAKKVEKISGLENKLKYYANTTLYRIGGVYRYVESVERDFKPDYQISSLKPSSLLAHILERAKSGIRLDEILDYLLKQDITRQDALAYIESLKESDVLVSELMPRLIDDDYLKRMINVLKNSSYAANMVNDVALLERWLKKLDRDTPDNMLVYQSIIQKINKMEIPYETNRLFHVVMTKELENPTLGHKIVDSLKSAIRLLYKINLDYKNENLERFKKNFYRRYEDRMVKMTEALDPIAGLGYPVERRAPEKTDLIYDILLPPLAEKNEYGRNEKFYSRLLHRMIDAQKKGNSYIELRDEDIPDLNKGDEDVDKMPETLYSLFNLLKSKKGDFTINLRGFYGMSAANIITRFFYAQPEIANLIKEIVGKEAELMPDKIVAEIVHLPNPAIGNVTVRPAMRSFIIPYMANPVSDKQGVINISDLFVFMKKGTLHLWSEKHHKIIIPRLTNTHNYNESAMPIYRFLSDMQYEGKIGNLTFNWGSLMDKFKFFPRLIYKDVILSPAIWKFSLEELQESLLLKKEIKREEIKKWRDKYAIPPKVLFSDFDQELLVNWENKMSIRSIIPVIKQRRNIIFKEFLSDAESLLVKDRDRRSYTHECVVLFYKA